MADTKNTTSPKRDEGRQKSHAGVALVGAALGLSILALAVPRLTSAVIALDSREVLSSLRDGQPIDAARQSAALADLERASAWVADGELALDRGYLLMQQADAAADVQTRAALRRQAIAATAAGLALSPSQPSAWARLAALRAAENDRQGAADALRLSMLTGAVAPALMASRLNLGLSLLPELDRDTTEQLRRQVRLTWAISPDIVGEMAQRPATGRFVVEALNTMSDSDVDRYVQLHGK
ncbi:MAG TPA: hypothetical protein VK558_10895 [Patescibacteria group bacterium]|nr:hypothetical protein [Patescibacteria group bacterium]